MYSAPYGGFPNAVPGSAGAGPTFNGGAPPPQNTHMQPGPSPNQSQMMYSNQQFPMGAQGHFSGANPTAMMAGAAGPAAMMQNPGMSHMTPNGQSKLPFLSFPTRYLLPPTLPVLALSIFSLFSPSVPCFASRVCVSGGTSPNNARGCLTPPRLRDDVASAPRGRPTFCLRHVFSHSTGTRAGS